MDELDHERAADRHAVIIAGGGPTGLMLAGELRLQGVDVAVLERRADHTLAGLRAGGLHMRTLELLDQRGIAARFVAEGQRHAAMPFLGSTLALGDAPTRHPYFLALWQTHVERLHHDWAHALGAAFYLGAELVDFTDAGEQVALRLADGRALTTQYLVGCDGGRSLVRKRAGIAFAGWDASTGYLIAELELTDEPPWGVRQGPYGVYALGRLEDGHARCVLSGPYAVPAGAPTLGDVQAALTAAYGAHFGLRSVRHAAWFSDVTRQATYYRAGRVLLAGDAAHVHSPVGGQGMNLGLQDAVNLGWKLGQVVRGTSSPALLDSYHDERHPAGARVLRATMALTALHRGDERSLAARELATELVSAPAARAQHVARMSGLDVAYALGEGHPLVGRRVPDLALSGVQGATRVFELLHGARPVLLDLRDQLAHWAGRVARVAARCAEPWIVPALGELPAPSALLIRPDGHVCWLGEGGDAGLAEALRTWC